MDGDNGRVGVGTTSPDNKLIIKQLDSNTSILRLDSASSIGSNTYEVGVDFYSRITGAGGTDSYPVGKIYGTGGSEFRSGKLRFQTIITNGGSLTDTMTLYQGNVGIGSLNTTPSTLLQVTGLKDTIVADFSSNTVGLNEGVSIQLSASANSYPLGVIRGIFTNFGGYSAMAFSTSSLNTPTEAMRITSSQNILMGTTTDLGFKLSVSGSTLLRGSGTTSASYALATQNSSGGTTMVVNNAGNMLIGTTTDAGFKLDVNGTGRFTNALTVGGSNSNNVSSLNVLSTYGFLNLTSSVQNNQSTVWLKLQPTHVVGGSVGSIHIGGGNNSVSSTSGNAQRNILMTLSLSLIHIWRCRRRG